MSRLRERLVQNAMATEQWTAVADSDLRLLLAAVEAAKTAWENGTNENLDALEIALDALYADDLTPDREKD